MNKQLVIPMSGQGSRFINAGYSTPKPLIKVFDKRIIQHIIEMYRGWEKILFIVNSEDFNNTELRLEEELLRISPNAKISVIQSHKFGPSYAVLKSSAYLINDGPIVINYCDFAGRFDLVEFEKKIFEFDCNLLTYTGFHPHMLRNTKYAFLSERNGRYTDIQEKQSYTVNPMAEEASAGAYSFKTKKLLIEAIENQIAMNLNFNGEFYTSLTVKSIIQDNGSIATTRMSRFYQWGTPEDLKEFIYWNRAINEIYANKFSNLKTSPNNVIALMGGFGNRLKSLTREDKPLIPILKKTLWEHSLQSINEESICILLARKEIEKKIKSPIFREIVALKENTKGQAHSTQIALSKIDNLHPISVLATDCIIPTNFVSAAIDFMNRNNLDLVVWSALNYPPSLQKSTDYSYVTGDTLVESVSLKLKLDTLDMNQEIITGNFTFRNKKICEKILDKLLKDESELINGEFYLDSTINIAKRQGLRVGKINVPNFLSIGTVEEYLTFNYWCN
jgi:NDP-sugar pyrophosphorylase family protein